MLALFFQKDKTNDLTLSTGEVFKRVSNDLDSHNYLLERVKNGDSAYLLQNYFIQNHPFTITYFTSWKETETVQEEQTVLKKMKEKKSILAGGLTSKKSKESKNYEISKDIKQQNPQAATEEVLYIQFETFVEVQLQLSLTSLKEFMSLLYLLASKVYLDTKCWPRMIPLLNEYKRYKFLKKGQTLECELSRLFEYLGKQKQDELLAEWNESFAQELKQVTEEEKRKQFIGQFLEKQIQFVLKQSFTVRVRKGQEMVDQQVQIVDCLTLLLKESEQTIKLDDWELSYIHQDSERRQIILEHNYESTLILEGLRDNLIIMYLKQFVHGI